MKRIILVMAILLVIANVAMSQAKESPFYTGISVGAKSVPNKAVIKKITSDGDDIKFYSGTKQLSPAFPNKVQFSDVGVYKSDTKGEYFRFWQKLGSPVLFYPIACELISPISTLTLVTGNLYYSLVHIDDTITSVAGLNLCMATAGSYTAGAYNGVGFYSLTAGVATRLAMTNNLGTLFTATAGTQVACDFPSALTNVMPGDYLVTLLFTQTANPTPPQIYVSNISAAISSVTLTNGVKITGFLSGQTTMPTTITLSSTTTGSNAIYLTGK